MDNTRNRCRDFHDGLVTFQCDQGLFRIHVIPSFYQHFNNRYIGKIADIGYVNFNRISHRSVLFNPA